MSPMPSLDEAMIISLQSDSMGHPLYCTRNMGSNNIGTGKFQLHKNLCKDALRPSGLGGILIILGILHACFTS